MHISRLLAGCLLAISLDPARAVFHNNFFNQFFNPVTPSEPCADEGFDNQCRCQANTVFTARVTTAEGAPVENVNIRPGSASSVSVAPGLYIVKVSCRQKFIIFSTTGTSRSDLTAVPATNSVVDVTLNANAPQQPFLELFLVLFGLSFPRPSFGQGSSGCPLGFVRECRCQHKTVFLVKVSLADDTPVTGVTFDPDTVASEELSPGVYRLTVACNVGEMTVSASGLEPDTIQAPVDEDLVSVTLQQSAGPCSLGCSFGGAPDATCSTCECTSVSVTVQVVDGDGAPLAGVSVTSTPPFATLSSTSTLGTYTLALACPRGTVTFTKAGYTPSDVSAFTSATLSVSLIRIVQPRVTVQPVSKYRITGQDVKLCCEASPAASNPSYQWSFNGQDLPGETGSMLSLTGLATSDSGEYQCSAESGDRTARSQPAVITVEDEPNQCSSALTSNIINLPPGCGMGSLDVKQCSSRRCQTDPGTSEECVEDGCCGPTAVQGSQISCTTGVTFTVNIVTECGCTECADPMFTINVIAETSNQAPVEGATVTINGVDQGTLTDVNGRFSAAIPATTTRIVISVKPPSFSLIEATSVIDVPVGISVTVERTMVLMDRAPGTTIDTTQTNMLDVIDSNGLGSPLGQLVIPALSLFTSDGDLYSGSAVASVTFIDPTNPNPNFPGVFETVSESGVNLMLETAGVFNVGIQDMMGNNLVTGSPISFVFSSAIQNNNPSLDGFILWEFNSETGQWDPLPPPTGRRRRQANMQIDAEIRPFRWVNIDQIRDPSEFCWFKARLYQGGLEVLQTDSGIIMNARVPLTEVTGVYFYGYTSTPASTCFRGVCNGASGEINLTQNAFNGFVQRPLNPFAIEEYSASEMAVLGDLSYQASDTSLSVDLDKGDNGPFYPTIDACTNSGGASVDLKFKLPVLDVSQFPLFYEGSSEETPGNIFISRRVWYQARGMEVYRACYLKVQVNGLPLEADSEDRTVKAFSIGTGELLMGEVLGVREEILDADDTACIEYKCSGTIDEQFMGGEDITSVYVVIGEGSQNCSGKFSENLPQRQTRQVDYGANFSIVRATENASGLYESSFQQKAQAQAARLAAKSTCEESTDIAAIITCGGQTEGFF